MIDYLKELNPQQKEAVLCCEPSYIVAGAGTGKTKTLTTKIAYLIDKVGILPTRILALTFTNNAAKEMMERIQLILGSEHKLKWCSTFHSFAYKILRLYIEDIPGLNYKKDFLILDEQDTTSLISEIKKQTDPDLKLSKDTILECIYNLKTFNLLNFQLDEDKENGLAFIQVWLEKNTTQNFESKDYESLFRIFLKYFKYIKQNNSLYFDDLQLYLFQLLRDNEKVSNKLNNNFDYILVDEFQDTDYIQFQILKLLRKTNKQIFVVGDPDQSIYGFRGARFENNADFLTYFQAKELLLSENYRSCQKVLDAANRLIAKNSRSTNIEKNLFSSTQKPGDVFFNQYDSDLTEVNTIVETIKKGHLAGKKYSDFAVLFRAGYLTRQVENALIKAKIPYMVWSSLAFFERSEVKDTLAFLSLIYLTKDNFIAFKRIANKPAKGLGEISLARLSEVYIETCEKLRCAPDIIAFAKAYGQNLNKANFVKYAEDIERYRKIAAEKTKVSEVIELFLDEECGAQYETYLKKEENFTDRLHNVLELGSFFLSYEKEYTNLTKADLFKKALDDIALAKPAEENINNMVILANIHKVKGLEFNTVFLYGLNDKVFPSATVINSYSLENLEEERRVCYVAVTRAKENLYISGASRRALFGRIDEFEPSIFYLDMQPEKSEPSFDERVRSYFEKDEKVNYHFQERYERKQKIKEKLIYSNETLATSGNLQIGDKVSHSVFGAGLVIGIKPKFVIVDFDGTQKLLSASFLTKIN